MGDGEKKVYNAEAAKDKERYLKEVEAYRKSNPEAPMFQVRALLCGTGLPRMCGIVSYSPY